MKLNKHTLGGALLLLLLFLGFVSLLSGNSLRQEMSGAENFSDLTQNAEAAANADLDRRHWFIQLYGGVQRLLGRSIVEDPAYTVARLRDGSLSFVTLDATPTDLSAQISATAALGDALAQRSISYLFVLVPQKIWSDDQLPSGVTNYANEEADQFLTALDGSAVDTLDLRDWFEANGTSSRWFFRTDHHWTPQAAFAAWGVLAGVLGETYGFAIDPALTDEANYTQTVYENFFLGSQGKRVGTWYAGTDDFTVYSPLFRTDLTYRSSSGVDRSGSFDQSVCFPERLAERDWFGGNPYTYYAGGDYALARVINHENPDGPKILLLRDSFACAITPFLSLGCSELVTADLRYYPGDLMELIEAEQPDLVITLYCASSLRAETLFR